MVLCALGSVASSLSTHDEVWPGDPYERLGPHSVGTYKLGFESAVCAQQPMVKGTHYAEFTLLYHQGSQVDACVGVVGASFDATSSPQPFDAARATNSVDGWLLGTYFGKLNHAGWGRKWKGIVGLLLELDKRTLSVCVNGSWRGVMVKSGIRNARGDVGELRAPLFWAVEVHAGCSVRIERKQWN